MVLLVLCANIWSQNTRGTAYLMQVRDAIGPATSDFIAKGLARAKLEQAALVVIQLDTPGGLDTAMREIIRNIIASPVPVALYVSPSGARAASAGTYMLYAAHVAAMAPGTNLGAATPVQIGGLPGIDPPKPEKPDPSVNGDDKKGQDLPMADPMTHKMVNDAVAYIRSLAEMRGRNADWAEQAVREAESLSARQALEQNVIDVIAFDVRDLLEKIDGMKVNLNGYERTLSTTDIEIVMIEPDWRNRFLSVITNPNIAYILMLLGVYGLFFELASPGLVLPGVIGAVSLLLALYAMQVLPINYVGLGLIILGIVFMVAELFVPSFGALGMGGIIAFIVGSIILFDKEGGSVTVSTPVIVAVSALSSGFFFIIIRSSINAFRKRVVSGREEMIGKTGEIMEDFERHGKIFIHGEAWNAKSDTPMQQGDEAIVTDMNGLILIISPTEEKDK